MKTSNKLLITAILIIIVSMVTYDFALRAEYLKGDYKSRFYRMESLNLKSFKIIDNRVANLVEVNIERGEKFGIWIDKNLKDQIKVTQNGSELVIDVTNRKKPDVRGYNKGIVITCPALDHITTNALIPLKEENGRDYSDNATTNLSGFNQQNLTLLIKNSTHINFEKNKIERLQATVGDKLSKNAYLFIATNNQINNAEIQVPGKNTLSMEYPQILKSHFTISDSANVNIRGSFLKQFKNQK